MLNSILHPLSFDFLRRALIMGGFVGILCPLVGGFLIVQRLGFMANVISHAVLPGLVIAQALGWDISLGALLSGLLSTGLLSWIENQSLIKPDAAMNAILASFFALGILLIPVLNSRLNLEAFLFGDILSVSDADLWRTGLILAAVILLILLAYRPVLFFSFDPLGAEARGLPVRLIRWIMTMVVSLTIIAGMQAVGVILIIALIACPALAAYLWVRELHWMLILGAGLGVFSAIAGLLISFWANLPAGAMIALVAFNCFFLSLLYRQVSG
jgi:manganese/iron transport system permease protein